MTILPSRPWVENAIACAVTACTVGTGACGKGATTDSVAVLLETSQGAAVAVGGDCDTTTAGGADSAGVDSTLPQGTACAGSADECAGSKAGALEE